MRFGILLDHQYAKGEDVRARIGELVDLVQHVRDAGYDSVFGVHHYLSNLATPQPLPLLSRIIEHSGDMALGTGILILPLGHPVHWAEEVATLDQMSGGRFVLGVGAGYREDEFASFGLDLKRRSSRMFEALEVMEKLWTGEEVHHEGEHFRLDGVRCSVLPYGRPRPEIWVGANGPVGIRKAARHGYSWLAPSNVKRNWAVGNLEEHRRESGPAGAALTRPIQRDLCLADSREEAFALAGEYARRSYSSYVQYGMDYFESMWQDICDKALFFGTPEEITARIRDFAAAGFDHFVFRVQWLGCPPEVSHGIVERFAREVMPHFKETPA